MLDITKDYFLPFAFQRLAMGTAEDQKEAIELLLLYRQVYEVPPRTRLEIVSRVVPLLTSSNNTVRYWVARILGEYDCKEAISPLKHALSQESDFSVRGWLEGALAHLQGKTVEDVIGNFESKDPDVRSYASQVSFFDADPQARILVAKYMKREQNPQSLSWQLLSLPGPTHMLRRAALVWTPSRLIHAPRQKKIDPVSDLIIDQLFSFLDAGDDRLAEYAIWNFSLGRVEKSLARIQELANPESNNSPRVREWAYKYLGFNSNVSSLPILLSALKAEKDSDAKEGIAFALGRIGGTNAFEALAELVEVDLEYGVRKWAVRGLGNLTSLWDDAEATLTSVIEKETNSSVIREIYSVLQTRESRVLLSKPKILETHIMPNQYQSEVLELLIVLCTSQMSVDSKNKLVNMLLHAPVEPSSILADAHVLAEDFEMSSKSFAMDVWRPVSESILNDGLAVLFRLLSNDDRVPIRSRESFSDARDLFDAHQQGLAKQKQDESSDKEPSPSIAKANFYRSLCTAHLAIINAIEFRLIRNVASSSEQFQEAQSFFDLYSRDLSLPVTERNLCAAIQQWLDAQLEVNFLLSHHSSFKVCCDRIIESLDSASSRSRDALRSSLGEHLELTRREIASLSEDSYYKELMDRFAPINCWKPTIPLQFGRSFNPSNDISINLVEVDVTDQEITLAVTVTVHPQMYMHLLESFNLALSVYSNPNKVLLEHNLLSSTQINANNTSFSKTLIIMRNALDNDLTGVYIHPILKFSGFEWPVSQPISLDLPKGESTIEFAIPADGILRKRMVENYDLEEFQNLCQDLNVDYDSLRGEGKAAKMREIILLMKRTNSIERLVEYLYRTADHKLQ